MPRKTKIEWTEFTWNPTTGCIKTSHGCKYCYAETLARRFQKYRGEFSNLQMHPNRLEIPLRRKKPTVYFVNSMSDLFHHHIPDDFIEQVFTIMNRCPQHVFQVLTKRADRIMKLNDKLQWTSNIWMGVTVENTSYYERIEQLRNCNAKIKFISCEPLLGSVKDINKDVNMEGIDWVIVGGESGRSPGPLDKSWVLEIREKCAGTEYSLFLQAMGRNK
jgi:protein gp37